jgi:hypothetical protein
MKRNLWLLLLSACAVFFTGCFETTEEITINKDGSGAYNMNLDLGGLFEFLDAMKSMDTSAAGGKNDDREKMDTTVAMREFTDTASTLTAAQKALFRSATMRMVMNEESKEFKMNMNFPFTQLSDVTKIMELSKSNGGNKVLGKMVMPGEVVDNGSAPKMPDLNNYYDLTFQPHLLERKLNKEKYKTLNKDLDQATMGEGEEMLAGIKMNTIIHLPSPAKKATGAAVKLSADIKTITLNGTMGDLMKNPEAFTYRIEY